MMRAAVIGCGRMGAEPSARLEGKIPAGWLPISHVESLMAIPEIKEIALCDHDQGLLKKRSELYNLKKIYTEYRELIDNFKPELITIATRTPSKCEIIKYASKNGVKGIYVEKPLANSIADVRRCLSLVKKYDVRLAYGVNRRYHAVYRQAKKMILKGEIGEVIEVVAEHGQAQLLWTHPHTMDLILFFLDETNVRSMQASIESSSLVVESELKFDSDPILENAFFKFNSGKTARIVRGTGFNIRIAGSQGNLVIHADGSFIEINKSNQDQPVYFQEQRIIESNTDKSATVIALSELVQGIKINSQLPISMEMIVAGTQMLSGCVWSAINEGKIILFDTIPENLVITGKFGFLYA